MPEATQEPSEEEEIQLPVVVAKGGVKALTIAQAKKGLAITFGVPPEAENVIRG